MVDVIEEMARNTTRLAGSIDPLEPVIAAAPPPNTSLPMTDTPELRRAIEETPAHLLLGVYCHLTGDTELAERCRPHIQSIWRGGPQLSAELQSEIRERTLARLLGPQPASPTPVTRGLLAATMGTVVGEEITGEFIPLLVEQMGFTPVGRFEPHAHAKPSTGFRVAVIGAGLSGIASAVKLTQAGYDYQVFEKLDEVGGVWWSNRYPGVAVDTPSHFYSYSFALNPDWPRALSDGAVLRKYWQDTVKKYGVRDKISFQTEVRSCVWQPEAKRWRLRIRQSDGSEHQEDFNALIVAAGLFSEAQPPNVPGLKNFKGKIVHTAHWDPTIDLTNKHVIQIGTGASGVQVGPSVAPNVANLTVFQRTPPYVVVRPAESSDFSEGFRWGMRHIPHLAQWMRFFTYWGASDGMYPATRRSPAYEGNDLAVNAYGEGFGNMIIAGMKAKLASRPDLIEKLIPKYPFMGKRPLRDSNWLDTLMRDNVELVAQAVGQIVEDGVLAEDGTFYPADVIILATGFKMTALLKHIEFVGSDGERLADVWGEEDPRAYLGTLVSGFPNLFIMQGPNFGATHGAGVNIYSEAQTHYVLRCLDLLAERQARSIEVKSDAFWRFNERVDSACAGAIWSHPKIRVYYNNSKHRNFISWPWRIVDMWQMMRDPISEDLLIE